MLRKCSRQIPIIAAATLACGCATTAPYEPTKEHSQALNVVNAVGFNDGNLTDKNEAAGIDRKLAQTGGFGAAYAASGVMSGGIAGGALSIGSWLLSSDSHTTKTTYFAWMPKGLAGTNPNQTLASLQLPAIKRALAKNGYEVLSENNGTKLYSKESDSMDGFLVHFMDKEGRCKNAAGQPICWIGAALTEAPEELENNRWPEAGPVFKTKMETMKIPFIKYGQDAQINYYALLKDFSQEMPKWFYVYVAPNTVKISNDKNFPYPVVLNQGSELFFIEPSS